MNLIMDMDFAEQKLGKGHRVMNADDLMSYALLWTEKLFGYPVSVDGFIDRKRCRDFKTMYKGDAGLIMKWMFVSKHGINHKGDRFKFSMLSKYWRDLHDSLLEEARAEMKRERDRLMGGDEDDSNLVTATSFLKKFKEVS